MTSILKGQPSYITIQGFSNQKNGHLGSRYTIQSHRINGIFRYIELIRLVNVDRYTMHWSGQISSRPHTTDFPQKVAFRKGNGTPYFTKKSKLVKYYSIWPELILWEWDVNAFFFMSHGIKKHAAPIFFPHGNTRHPWVFRTGGGSPWKSYPITSALNKNRRLQEFWTNK